MILISLFIFLTAQAAQPLESTFTVGQQKITIYNYPEQRISISEKCDKISRNDFCTNIEFLKDLGKNTKKAKLPVSTGGANPASAICNSVLNGIVIVAVDTDRNENSFCKLPSGIYIDSGTLTYYSKQ